MSVARNIAWKRRLGRLWPLMCARDKHRKLILLYHAIGDGPWAIRKHCFEKQIAFLRGAADILPVKDLIACTPPAGVSLSITFDDGYACLRDNALPVLMDCGLTATVFLNTGEVGDQERFASREKVGHYPGEEFLAWRDVDNLIAAGWFIGSHGVHHIDLTVASTQTQRDELSRSKRDIEKRTGLSCDVFAYTWGRHTARLRESVRNSGYCYAVAGGHATLNHRSNPLAIPRMNVAQEYTLDDLAAIIRGDWDYLDWIARAKGGLL